MSAYCASCLHIANEALLLQPLRQVAGNGKVASGKWQISEKSMQQLLVLPCAVTSQSKLKANTKY